MKNQEILKAVQERLSKSIDSINVTIEIYDTDRHGAAPHIQAVYAGWNKMDRRIEELDKFFSVDMFCMGIEQRKDWVNATAEEKDIFVNQGGHPSSYKAV